MSADSCNDLLNLALELIDKYGYSDEAQRVFEKIRNLVMLGKGKLSEKGYYWFCHEYGYNCLILKRYQESAYFLRRAVSIAKSIYDYEEVADSVNLLLFALIQKNQSSEAIAIGEKYLSVCSGQEGVYKIMTALCFLYHYRNWNRKAQVLANKVIEHKRKAGSDYYESITCFLFKCAYNNGRCKNREDLLSEWYDVEIRVNGMKSSTAMEVLAEKAMVIAMRDKARVPEAARLMDEAIPVLEKCELEYWLEDMPHVYAFQAAMKNDIGDRDSSRKLFAKAKASVQDPEGDGKEYLSLIEKCESEIEKTHSEKDFRSGKRSDI